NWTRISSLNLMHNVTSCTFNPNNPSQIFATTEYEGLWMCSNVNAANPVFSQVANYPFKQPERVYFNPYNLNEMWVSSFGNGLKMGTLLPTGIPRFEESGKLQVYPNPSSGSFRIETGNAPGDADVIIFNNQGQALRRMRLAGGAGTLDLSDCAPGIYWITSGTFRTKVIITR
ncbi:MAG TPA: T9SS type A sorting domain-containing protein, partial [Bacteroidia bacterium]|nr:T9SS type A sorting domain-containing protein [Bacteroidia bacterium]